MKLRFNLFWKIFLWLWLTLILFIGVHFLLMGFAWNETQIKPAPDSALTDLQRMAARLEKSGEHRRWRRRLERSPGEESPRLELFLLDAEGREADGKPLDRMLVLLHNRYLENGRPQIAYRQQHLYIGPLVIDRDGAPRYLYSYRRLPPLGQEHIRMIWSRTPKNLLLSAILITFPVCFALAWYLSSPIRRLQQATHEFSSTQKVPAQIAPLLERGDEFGDLARDFSQMAQRVQNTLESQKRLLSDVSHELRSPLARLRIALGLTEQKTGNNPQLSREIDQMALECERIDSLIGQLLDIARLDVAAPDIETVDFDLHELVVEIMKDAELEAGQKNLTLRDSLPDRLITKGVPEMLRGAVENVLRNAIRYAPAGSDIEIELSTGETSHRLTIRDHGPGVEDAHLDKIFEPFYRPEYARGRDSGGSGLGLAIAKRAVEHHAGYIRAENAPGGGLQVIIELPASEPR